MVIDPDQRRRLQYIAAALLAFTLVVAGLVVAFSGNDDNKLNVSEDGTTTTLDSGVPIFVTGDSTTSSSSTTVTTTKGSPPTSSTSTTPTTKPTAKTTVPPETADLDCVKTTPAAATPVDDNWNEYWTTKPLSNKAMQVQLCIDDATPKVGQTVTISVIAYDPDQQVGTGTCDIRVTWSGSPASCTKRTTTVVQQQEPPPDPQADSTSVKKTYTHKYSDSGDVTIDISAWSGADDQARNPYKSYASITRQITVHK